MKIALVKPSMGTQGTNPYRSRAMMEPLAFAVLAGMIPPEHEVVFFDERMEPVSTGEKFDLAAISVETYTARRAYEIAAKFRQHGITVVMGGFHPTLCPDEAALHADAIIIGEAEMTWREVLADAQAGTLRDRYISPGRSTLADMHIDRTIFKGKTYLPLALIQYTRGCRYSCEFCSIKSFYGENITHRSLDDVLREIDGLSTRNIFFVDDNITADREAAVALFTALAKRRVRWVTQVSLDIVTDLPLLDLMVKSGCFGLILGLESLNPKNMAQMHKAWANSLGGYAHALNIIKQRGILVYGAFVFGYDYDTVDSFRETVDFAIAQKLFLATFNPLQPFPGTPLYTRLQSQGRLLYDRWWMDPRYLWERLAFQPAQMSLDEFADATRQARRRFASAGSILRRAVDFQAHLKDPFRAAIYFAGNMISDHDIRRKEGLTLGFALKNKLADEDKVGIQ